MNATSESFAPVSQTVNEREQDNSSSAALSLLSELEMACIGGGSGVVLFE